MAFTKEQIDAVFSDNSTSFIDSSRLLDLFQKSSIYEPVVAYLTGDIQHLPALQPGDDAYSARILIYLLNDIERPSANDQMILHLIKRPDLASLMRNAYADWLIKYSLKHKGKAALKAFASQVKSLGFSDEHILGHLVLSIGFADEDADILFQDNIANDFITEMVLKAKQLIYPKAGYLQYHYDWSMYYFRLVEQTRPAFAMEYLLYGVYSDHRCPAPFFHSYRNGYYMPAIVEFLENNQGINLPTLQSKFITAIRLNESFEGTYLDTALKLAGSYIDYVALHHARDQWDKHIELTELKDLDFGSTALSTVAFHLLLKHRRAVGIEALNRNFSRRIYTPIGTLKIVHHHLKSESLSFFYSAIKADVGGGDFYRNLISLVATRFSATESRPLLWKLASNKSRMVKQELAQFLAKNDPEAESKGIELLNSKTADSRQTAALLLSMISSPGAVEAISNQLHKEKNDNTRDDLLQAVASTFPNSPDFHFVDTMLNAAKARGKLNEPQEPWLDESLLPPLFDSSGSQLGADYIRFLLYRMSRIKEMRSDIEARYILNLIDREKSTAFSIELIRLLVANGAKPEHKYLLALAALAGDESIVDKLRLLTNRWMEESRHKMSEYAVGALALQGSNKALRWIEWYSRKYKNKKANVGAAALAALETAAAELGVSVHELGDLIVPDFGVQSLFKHFEIGDDEYRAFVDSNFKIAFFNENNKKLKSLPSAASGQLKDEFKEISKEIKDIVRSQSSRMEYYLTIQRRWEFVKWEKLFLQNPVMFIYACKLLWGRYDQPGKLLDCFICNEDTSLENLEAEEVEMEVDTIIGIVHPTEMDNELLQAWKKKFFQLSIEPIFPQLDRKLANLNDIDRAKTMIRKFEGLEMAAGSIRSTLERFGWHKGPVVDGGMIQSMNLHLGNSGMEAILEVEGVGAGSGWSIQEKTGRLYVIRAPKAKVHWFLAPQNDNDERLVVLDKVPDIFLREIVAAIETIRRKEA